jgi:peptidoglycan/xylan/chitin deacetylase (PgdA/CDA1 family)
MMATNQPLHPRKRRWPLVMALALALLGAAAGISGIRVLRENRRRVNATLVVGGVPRQVRVPLPSTVAATLKAGKVVPRPGRLLSVVTGGVVDPTLHPPQLRVEGLPVTPQSIVAEGATLEVIETPDAVEGTVEVSDVIPAPPMPVVIHGMWHPGQPGLAVSRRGAFSGELVAQQEVQAPVPPTPVTENLVALTFDDGPWASTPEVLRILREKNVKATFCVVSRQLKKDGLAWAIETVADGHRLCNHTVNHDAGLPGKSQKVVDQEIRGANEQLLERTGVRPAYYRPPAGKTGPSIEAAVKAEGQQILLWTIDTKDFQRPPPEAIIHAVMANVKPGAVVLLHDGGGDRAPTLAALPVLIDQLRAAGYELVLPDAIAPVAAAPVVPVALPA